MSPFHLQAPLRHLALLVLAGLLLCIALPVSSEEQASTSPIMVPNPGTDMWRTVRQRELPGVGRTQVRGVDTGVLINKSGNDFRKYRRQQFIGIAGMVLGGVAAAILVFFLLRGRVRIPGGRSGRPVKRFTHFDRTVHWFAAVLFIFLGLTGLTLLFGRFVLLPLFGPEVFAVVASACKEGHNLFGPLFLIAVLLLFIRFAAENLPARGDLKWIFKGGGMIGKGHVSAGYFNTGEKLWFWAVTVLGVTVSLTGLVLVFPILGQGRDIMQLALIVHGAAAVLFIAGSFGHIYIGTLGMEGSLESMTTGYVDENWAKSHHDRWYAEVKDETPSLKPEDEASGARISPPLRASPDKA